jgi:chaperonin cofactor prefoldin
LQTTGYGAIVEAMTKSWTDERLEERFDRIDQRFDEVDRRFESVDRRFDEINRRSALAILFEVKSDRNSGI